MGDVINMDSKKMGLFYIDPVFKENELLVLFIKESLMKNTNDIGVGAVETFQTNNNIENATPGVIGEKEFLLFLAGVDNFEEKAELQTLYLKACKSYKEKQDLEEAVAKTERTYQDEEDDYQASFLSAQSKEDKKTMAFFGLFCLTGLGIFLYGLVDLLDKFWDWLVAISNAIP